MANLIEFGERQKKKEKVQGERSRIDSYLREMRRKEEILKELDEAAGEALLDYGFLEAEFSLNEKSVRRFLALPIQGKNPDNRGDVELFYDRITETEILRFVLHAIYCADDADPWRELCFDLYRVEKYALGQGIWLLYNEEMDEWEVCSEEAFDIDEILGRGAGEK